MNTYKLTTFVLIVLVIFLLYREFNIEQPKEDIDEKSRIALESEVDYALLNTLSEFQDTWRGGLIDSVKTGRPVTLNEAINKMRVFNQWNRIITSNDTTYKVAPFAFAFGNAQIRRLLRISNRYNRNLDPSDTLNRLEGIRVYLTFTEPVPGSGKKHLDLVMIPVKANGDDMFDINPDSLKFIQEPPGLNTSAPCPNNCDDQ